MSEASFESIRRFQQIQFFHEQLGCYSHPKPIKANDPKIKSKDQFSCEQRLLSTSEVSFESTRRNQQNQFSHGQFVIK